MKILQNNELNNMDLADLKVQLQDSRKEYLRLRLIKNSDENKKNHVYKIIRRQIARVMTYITAKAGDKI